MNLSKAIGSIVRHGISAVSGALLTIGVEQVAVDNLANALVPVIGGVVSYGVSVGLSMLREKLRH